MLDGVEVTTTCTFEVLHGHELVYTERHMVADQPKQLVRNAFNHRCETASICRASALPKLKLTFVFALALALPYILGSQQVLACGLGLKWVTPAPPLPRHPIGLLHIQVAAGTDVGGAGWQRDALGDL